MPDNEFYKNQYASLVGAIDRAITALDNDSPFKARTILLKAIQECEEAYIQEKGERKTRIPEKWYPRLF